METLTLDELGPLLRATIDAAREEAQRETPDEHKSYWRLLEEHGAVPPITADPEHYDGSEVLNISWTHGDYSARVRRQLLEKWVKTLPTMSSVRRLWIRGRVPQNLFDAACSVHGLEGLHMYQSTIETIEPLSRNRTLKYVHLGTVGGLCSIEPLRDSSNLRWLEVSSAKRITDLAPLEGLTRLEGLAFTGADGKPQSVKSLAPLSHLTNLRWLFLGAIRVEDGSLGGLYPLKNLKWLTVGNFFTWEEFAKLSAHLPSVYCKWLQAASPWVLPCKQCGTDLVFLSGIGKSTLCPKCHAKRVRKHIEEFQAVAWSEGLALTSR